MLLNILTVSVRPRHCMKATKTHVCVGGSQIKKSPIPKKYIVEDFLWQHLSSLLEYHYPECNLNVLVSPRYDIKMFSILNTSSRCEDVFFVYDDATTQPVTVCRLFLIGLRQLEVDLIITTTFLFQTKTHIVVSNIATSLYVGWFLAMTNCFFLF